MQRGMRQLAVIAQVRVQERVGTAGNEKHRTCNIACTHHARVDHEWALPQPQALQPQALQPQSQRSTATVLSPSSAVLSNCAMLNRAPS